MEVFKLPLSVCDDLTKLVRNFYWGAKDGKRITHWRAWEKQQRPKKQGGLGFRDFRVFNQALLARQAWRLLTKPDSLCAQVLKAKYYPNGRLEDTVFSANASSTWQAISHGLDLLKKGLIWRVGNGQCIRIWRDAWIPMPPTYKPISLKRRCRLWFVLELLDQFGNSKVDLLNQYFLPCYFEDQTLFTIDGRPSCLGSRETWAVYSKECIPVCNGRKLEGNNKVNKCGS
jgi:hypothetical protein